MCRARIINVCMYLCVSVCVGTGDVVGGVVVVSVGTPLPLLQVDPVSLALRQVKEVLHGFQVDQQRLRGRARILLLTEDF